MGTPVAVLRTSEISLKGSNRRLFERQLAFNVKKSLKNNQVGFVSAQRLRGRLLVYFEDEKELDKAKEVFGHVFGVENYSTGILADKDIDNIKSALEQCLEGDFESFRVSAKRQDKKFHMSSPEIERELGGFIQSKTGKQVDLKNFEREFYVEVTEDGVAVSPNNYEGPGGLPVGTGGSVGVLAQYENAEFAAYCMMKRGCRVVFFGQFNPSYVSGYNNFEEPEIYEADTEEDVLGTMEEERILALVAGCGPEKLAELKERFPGTLVLAPLVGLHEEEIRAKNI